MYVFAVGTLETQGDPERTTITWSTDLNPARVKQVGIFHDMYPGIEVIVEKRDETKLMVRCATGTGPDVIDVYDVFELSKLVEAGVLMDLTPYAEELGFSADDTYASLRDGLVYDGKLYRYPCNVHANAIIYNRAILEDHDAPLPTPDWTWDDLIESALAVRNNPSKSGAEHIPLSNWSGDGWLYYDMLVGLGGTLFSQDGLHSALDSDVSLTAMRKYRDMALVHDIMPTSAEALAMSSQGGWGAGGIAWFFNQQAAYISIGRWAIVRIPAYVKRNPGLADKLEAVVMPRFPGVRSRVVVRSRAAGINLKSHHPQEAMRFLQYLSSGEYGRLIIRDGDSLPPSPDLATTGADLVNDIIDRPEFHQPFIDAVKDGVPLDTSPFIEAQIAKRWITEAVQQVENGADPDTEMRRLAREINMRIRLNLRRRPDLQARYEVVTGRAYREDWHTTQVASRPSEAE